MNRILSISALLCILLLLSMCQNRKSGQNSQDEAPPNDEEVITPDEPLEEEADMDQDQAEETQAGEEPVTEDFNYIIAGSGSFLYFFGASGAGIWHDLSQILDDFNEPLDFHIHTINGFSETHSLGKTDLNFDEYCGCPEFFLDGYSQESFYVGITGDWNPFSEDIDFEPMNTEYSEEIGLAYLMNNGLEDPELSIDEVIELDIDDDGTMDAIIDLFHEERGQNYGSAAGSYSVLLMVFDVREDPVAIPILSNIYTHDGENEMDMVNDNNILAIADLNGDGIFELAITDSYYEGGGTVVLSLWNDKFEKMFRCFCGS